MKKIGFYFLLTILSLVCCPISSHGLKVEITQGQIRPDPVAISNFYSPNGELKQLGEKIAELIGTNLVKSGLFETIPSTSFIQTAESLANQPPRYGDWRLIKTRFLVCGTLTPTGLNSFKVDFYLHDVITGQQLLALSLESEQLKWRKLAHIVSDNIYSRITNEKGFFNTHIVYVEVMGPRGRTVKKRLMRMDYDGENRQILTDGKSLVLMPRYSPDGKTIAYLSYANKVAQVRIIDLITGKESPLGGMDKLLRGFGDMTFAPRFTPDSRALVMSLVKQGKTAIYHYDLYTRTLTRLTEHNSIDTSPCVSPDGKKIVFTSDRDKPGGEQIYVMDINGSNVHRISWGDGKYSQPVWSPRGDLIAFTKQYNGTFYIGLMATDGTGERLITSSYLVENPDWAPNGRYLIFSRESRGVPKGQIVMIDLTGHHQLPIKASPDSCDSTWSPLLQ